MEAVDESENGAGASDEVSAGPSAAVIVFIRTGEEVSLSNRFGKLNKATLLDLAEYVQAEGVLPNSTNADLVVAVTAAFRSLNERDVRRFLPVTSISVRLVPDLPYLQHWLEQDPDAFHSWAESLEEDDLVAGLLNSWRQLCNQEVPAQSQGVDDAAQFWGVDDGAQDAPQPSAPPKARCPSTPRHRRVDSARHSAGPSRARSLAVRDPPAASSTCCRFPPTLVSAAPVRSA